MDTEWDLSLTNSFTKKDKDLWTAMLGGRSAAFRLLQSAGNAWEKIEMSMSEFEVALINKDTGTYFDASKNEYILVMGGKVVGRYSSTGNKETDHLIDCMMWDKCLRLNIDFNPNPPLESQDKS